MATVTRGAQTTQTKQAVGPAKLVAITEKIKAEQGVEQPIVYISTEGKDGAWIVNPEPLHDANNGRFIRMEPGVYLRFTNGTSDPFYLTNPVDRNAVKLIDKLIDENWPQVHVLGLKRLDPGQPAPPLQRWDRMDLESIKIALESNFGDDSAANVRVCEAGVRYELAKDKKGVRKDVIALCEALAATEVATASDVDPLNV